MAGLHLFRRSRPLAEPINEDEQKETVKAVKRPLLPPKLVITLVIVGCMAAVVAVSLRYLMPLSLRLDESQSLWQASHSYAGMLQVVAKDVHVPLYHSILHFWIMYLGDSVETVRSLSLIFFLATIPLMYVFARQALSRGWALFVVVLYSSSPFMNWYGSETRMYTLLVLMSLLSQIFFVKIIKENKGWFAYGLVAVVGVYSHYFFSFTLATQGLFYLLNYKKFAPGTFKKLAIVMILAGLSLSPWLRYFISMGAGANESPLLPKPSTVDFFNAFSQFAFGFQDNHWNTILVSFWPALVLIGFFAIQRNLRMTTTMQYMLTAAFVPVLAAYGLSMVVTPFFLSRYMITVVPSLTILVVWFVSHYRFKLAVILCALLLLTTCATFAEEIRNPESPVKENYRAAALLISKQAKPQDVVVLSAPFTVYPFQYYYNGAAQIQTLPLWNRTQPGNMPGFDPKTMPAQIQSLSADHTDVYLLLSYNQGYENKIRNYYTNHYHMIETRHFSPDLNLYVFRVGYNTVPPL